jgi:squalene-hopene/tetraprenyl-beta-curcumene cyclase
MRLTYRLIIALGLPLVVATAAMSQNPPSSGSSAPSPSQDAASAKRQAVAPPPADQTYQPPARALDERIKPDAITQYDPPPLPQQVILPKPPVHRIAERAEQVPISPETFAKAKQAIDRGLKFLRASQSRNGSWSPKAEAAPTDQPEQVTPVAVAITALALKSFVQAGHDAETDEQLRKAVSVILAARQSDGSFAQGGLANYITSAALSSLAAVGDQDSHDFVVDSMEWLQSNQWDQSEGLSARQDWFGGAGYGNNARPDLSNTQMMLDALYDAGLSPDEPAFQKALAFVSRTQNLKETNKAEWTGNDGGFIYTPANGGESMASEAAGEGRKGEKLVAAGQPRSLRSYGSMTYAGFKSMLYAGLSPDDVRVRAAFDWLRNNWTFEKNPGLDQQGLYYYYHTLARALNVAQQDEITDAKGVKHNWREELIAAVIQRQQSDGSWSNDADRWMEGDPALVTAYCVLALEEALKPAKE